MLDQQTEMLIAECFAGKVCRKCGTQADRFVKGKFYCNPCLTRTTYTDDGEDRKVHKATWRPERVE